MSHENNETFRMRMWATNDEGVYQRMLEVIQDSDECEAADILSEVSMALRSMYEEYADEAEHPHPFLSEAVECFLSAVDWDGIAEHYTDDANTRADENAEAEAEDDEETK